MMNPALLKVVGLVLALGLGCSGSKASHTVHARDSGVAGSSVPILSAEKVASPPDTALGNSTRIESALGVDVAAAVRKATGAEFAALRVTPVIEAEKMTFESGDRIAGHPIQGSIRPLGPPELARVVGMLLNDNSYAFDARIRCRNSSFVGIRFSTTTPVEFALGIPCNQAVWAFKQAGKAERWGAAVSKQAASAIGAALSTSSPKPRK